jgi:glycosyltransferase involved in cell wall biosynthesis
MNGLTVVIPAYNRAGILKKALDGYRIQSPSGLIRELIVVDDGSTDNTEAVVEEVSKDCEFAVRYIRQSNKGPAAARNVGIREAQSQLILFTDSDIVPERDLVSQHVKWHSENPEDSFAVLGYVTWPREPKPTPFMKWYGEAGPLFAYRQFRNKREISYRFLYTCNLSLKAKFLRTHGQFDEDFKSAAWEDIELGYRLSKAGLRLLYNPQALAYHNQFFTFADVCRKAEANSSAREIFAQKEAGKHFHMEQQEKRANLGYRFAEWAAVVVGAVLHPAKALLDSDVPLPAVIYRSLYWYYVNRFTDVSGGHSETQSSWR